MDQDQRKLSRKLSDEILDPKKYGSLLKTLLNGEKYTVYHEHIIKANFYLKLGQSVSSLIRILQNSARSLSVIVGLQQDL